MIESYSFGQITIDSKKYTSDVLIFPDRVNSNWWRKSGHKLCVEDIEEVIKEEPEILVVGKGNPGLMNVSSEVKELLKSKGIELIIENTKSACKRFNELIKSKKVIAALHLTC